MATKASLSTSDPEIAAISAVYDALKNLDAGSQERVLDYVAGKLGVASPSARRSTATEHREERINEPSDNDANRSTDAAGFDETDGISDVALKWMRRSGITVQQLSKLFSVGGDEIDLVAERVPGSGKKERMRSVILLKGIAAYLSTGAARVSHEQIKEACLHYDAYDSTNFSRHLKSYAAEVSGTRESGYSLSPRGLTKATEIIKSMLAEKD